tara:strand:- start:981 stop:1790 length:810 start_codon:yes stop_codon:yes gene_type:complete
MLGRFVFGGILASIVLVATLFGMLKFKSEDFDKSMMYGTLGCILLLWIIPWGLFVIIPLGLVLSIASPAARLEWSTFKNRRIAICIVLILLLNSFALYPVSEPEGAEEWGNPIATENPHAAAWPASEQYTWFYDGAVIGIVNARTPHTFCAWSQDSSSIALGVMLGMHDQRMRQSIEVMNSYIPTFSIDSETFSLEEVETEGSHKYADEDYFVARFNVKKDGFETTLATVLIVGFPNAGGELTLLSITRPITSSQDDVFEEKIVLQYVE